MNEFTLGHILNSKENKKIFNMKQSDLISTCILKMAELKIGALLIVDDNEQLVGIFSERDVVNRIYPKKIDIEKTAVDKVMTKDLLVVDPTTTITQAMIIFTERRFRHLPVVKERKLLGIVSSGDVTKWIISDQEKELRHLTNYIRGEER